MKRALSWLACSVALGLLLCACGSGGTGDPDGEAVATGTPRSERAERQSTIMQQQQGQSDVALAEQAAQTAQVEDAEVEAERTAGEDAQDLESVAAGEIDFGHRKGLPFNRNVVGDPQAPVVIVEYSDFQ